LIRNTVHTSWSYFPDNEKDETVTFQGTTFQFATGTPLKFISWDLLGQITESVSKIAIAVVRDANVVRLTQIKDFGVETALPGSHGTLA
jgi:hypothetical protein